MFARLQHDVSIFCVSEKGQLLLLPTLPPSNRELNRQNLEAGVRVLINNQPEDDRLFFQAIPVATTVVFALHGLNKHGKPTHKNSYQMGADNSSTCNLNFGTRLGILKESIAIRRRKNADSDNIGNRVERFSQVVTAKDAAEAFLNVVMTRMNQPSQIPSPDNSVPKENTRRAARISQKDYFTQTANFAIKLTALAEEAPYYFDMHAGITSPNNANNAPTTGIPPITVTEHIIGDGDERFRVIVICNPTSPGYNSKYLENTESECLFAEGDVIGTSSKCRSIRFAAPTDKEVFEYGGGTKKSLIGTAKLTSNENKLGIDFINWIMRHQTEELSKQFSSDNFLPFDNNSCISLHGSGVGSAFDSHSDAKIPLYSEEMDCLAIQKILPRTYELQTATQVWCNDPNASIYLNYQLDFDTRQPRVEGREW
jgi:hypothetical protein